MKDVTHFLHKVLTLKTVILQNGQTYSIKFLSVFDHIAGLR